MAQAPVVTDQYAILAQRLQTLTRVMTTNAPIAQTPKQLVWTLNKAKLASWRHTGTGPRYRKAGKCVPTP